MAKKQQVKIFVNPPISNMNHQQVGFILHHERLFDFEMKIFEKKIKLCLKNSF